MNKKLHILSFILFVFFTFQSSFVFGANAKCSNPELYGLSSDEVNMSNSEFYCWEIRYLKQYHNIISTSLASYNNFYAKDLNSEDINVLRKLGITPEKYDYLRKYFIDDDEIANGSNLEKVISKAVSVAKKELKNKLEYQYGKPIMRIEGNLLTDGNPIISAFEKPGIYDSLFIIYGEICSDSKNVNQLIEKYPDALKPIGVIGKYYVNAFGEVSFELYKTEKDGLIPSYNIRLINTEKSLGAWKTLACSVTDFSKSVKRGMSCTACTMFEIAFNTVSKIGFVLYDKLSRYALDLMIVLFSLWSLLMFFEHAIKKQDGFSYIKTFFTKIVWVFIIGAFLSVSITDENNIINYTIRPLTDFMSGYNKIMTKAIDSTEKEWKCSYAARDLKDNRYLFSKDIKQDIVCTIERIADYNNMNILIGVSQIKQGFKKILNFKWGQGITKLLLGLTIVGIFFIFNLSVPYFFIESLFKIAIVVFLFPLFLIAYALNKKSFVKNGLNTFLSAISQIIALSIMCSIISLLMFYISSLDLNELQDAILSNNSQEVASSMLLFFSFNTNKLLEIIYTGIICWWLMGQALKIANIFGSDSESLPKTFQRFMTSTVKTATSVVTDYYYIKVGAGKLAEKIKNMKEKEQKPAETTTTTEANNNTNTQSSGE